MILKDFLVICIILKSWIPAVVTSIQYPLDLDSAASVQRETAFEAQQRLRTILYDRNDEKRTVLTAFPAFFQSNRHEAASTQNKDFQKLHSSRPINIFGHYQSHQEVTPVQQLYKTFRPSPPDPTPIRNDDDNFQPAYQNVRSQNLTNQVPPGQKLNNHVSHVQNIAIQPTVGQNFNDEIPPERLTNQILPKQELANQVASSQKLTNKRHPLDVPAPGQPFLDIPDDIEVQHHRRHEDRTVRQGNRNTHARERSRAPPAHEPRDFGRENLLSYLYQSYLDNLTNNGHRQRPNVEVNTRSNSDDAGDEYEEIDANLLMLTPPPIQTFSRQDLRARDDNPNHFVVPIQKIRPQILEESLKEDDEERQKYENEGFEHRPENDDFEKKGENEDFQNFALRMQPSDRTRQSKSFQSLTSAPRSHSQSLNQRNTAQNRATLGQIQPNFEREILKPFARQPLISNQQSNIPPQREIQNGDDEIPFQQNQRIRHPHHLSRQFQIPSRNFQNPSRQFQNPDFPRPNLNPLQRLQQIFPSTFQNNRNLNTFLTNEKPKTSHQNFLNSDSSSYKPKPIGKSLYFQGKSLGNVGGLFSVMQVFPEYHSYGIPISRQHTPMVLRVTQSRSEVKSKTPKKLELQNFDSGRNEKAQIRKPGILKPAPPNPAFEFSTTTTIPETIPNKSAVSTQTLLRRPIGLRNLMTRHRPRVQIPQPAEVNDLETKKVNDLQIQKVTDLQNPNVNDLDHAKAIDSPAALRRSDTPRKVIVKKMRTRKTVVEFSRAQDSAAPKFKPTKFPMKYSSRFRTEAAQILPTTIPTLELSPENGGNFKLHNGADFESRKPNVGSPFSSAPRRLTTTVPVSHASGSKVNDPSGSEVNDFTRLKVKVTDLPSSVLLSPRDVLINRKPARRIPSGSFSHRLKTLKKRPISDSNFPARTETDDFAGIISNSKREITQPGLVRQNTNGIVSTHRMPGKVENDESEFSFEEMRKILGIPKPVSSKSVFPARFFKTIDEDGEEAKDETVTTKSFLSRDDFLPGNSNSPNQQHRQYLSIPIVTKAA